MSRRFLILANPIAGGGRARKRAPELQEALQGRGMEAELFFSQQAGDLGRRASEVESGQYTGVVSVGGDGTLNEVLNGLPDPTVPLCTMGMGTANVLACELRLPRKPAQLAALLDSGATLACDIGIVRQAGDTAGRRFLLFVSAGMDAAIVERLEQVRQGTAGKLAWTGPILHTIRRWPLRELGIRPTEGNAQGKERAGFSTVLVTTVRNYGGVLRLPRGMEIQNRGLHVLCFRQRTRWQYFRAVMRALARRLRTNRDFELVVENELEIFGNGVPFQVDGDLGGEITKERPLQVSVYPAPARIFVP